MKKDTKIAIVLIVLAILIVVIPPFALKGAEFGGSDDAGSQKIEEIAGDYEPWFTPVFETALNGEIPGEIESLLFCVQTAIGVGIIAFLMGRMVERKKWSREEETEQTAGQRARQTANERLSSPWMAVHVDKRLGRP